MIPKNDPMRLLHEILKGLDYKKLLCAYSNKGRKSAGPPIIMFKILVYAYMNRTYSSRDMARLCTRDINFIWLLRGFEAPSHNVINRFRKNRLIDGVMEDLFDQLVNLLFELDEIKFENLFVDGSKFEANTNRYTFKWKNSIVKYEAKLHEKIIKFLTTYNEAYATNYRFNPKQPLDTLSRCINELKEKAEENQVEFV